MSEAVLHDGSRLAFEVRGHGPALLLPLRPHPMEGPQADSIRAWGGDPDVGATLIQGLSDAFTVVAFDYEGHVLAVPKPDTLTPDHAAADLLAVADAAGVSSFAYYGYSWLALLGLQLAIRTDRLSALVMGGFPPLHGPYAEMLRVTMATYELALHPPKPKGEPVPGDWSSVDMTLSVPQTRQFVTLYEALRGFDDVTIQERLKVPRLCFVGAEDNITYGKEWGDVEVRMAGIILEHRARLEALGWDVTVLPGMDHMKAMQAEPVLGLLRPWLESKLG